MRLFDLHCDTLYECDKQKVSLLRNSLQLDLERGSFYAPWCQVMAAWIPDTLRGEAAFSNACRLLDIAKKTAKENPARLRITTDPDLIESPSETGCTALLAIEGGAALAGSLDHVDDFYEQGVRMLTLTWNGENELGFGCGKDARKGLKPFGKAAVRRLCEQGIVPDVSHLNEAGFWEVAEYAETPFIASHSPSRAVCDHRRNLTDEQFAAIRECGGLVGLNLCAAHLGEQTFEQFYRHVDHYLEQGGEHIVALGMDLDGTDLSPAFRDIGVAARLAAYLRDRGLREDTVDALFFGNAQKFFIRALQTPKNVL